MVMEGQRSSRSRGRVWQLGSSQAGRSTCRTISGDSSLSAGRGAPSDEPHLSEAWD